MWGRTGRGALYILVIYISLSEKSLKWVYECMGRPYRFEYMTALIPYLCNNVK
jgi:hypothetical protein